jgi:D-alanyl-lipoteichoic acid acyltransferase DltB (MBOAT superfamily)
MFVAWGLWHGIGLVVCRGWKSLKMPLPAPAGWLLTMLFVLVGWIMFRAPDWQTFVSISGSMIGFGGAAPIGSLRSEILLEAVLPCVLIPSAHEMLEIMKRLGPRPAVVVLTAMLAAFCVLEVGKGAPAEFIYFRF